MKKILLYFTILTLVSSCTQLEWDEIIQDSNNQILEQTLVDTVPNVLLPNNIQYDANGNMIPDFIPALQPFVNEGCQTAWDNLSAIVNPNGSVTYFTNLPDYTADPTDLDKDRFTFIFQAQNPWYGGPWDDGTEEPYAQISSAGWYTLPVDDYGNMTCEGLQEIRIWVLDELTNTWYMNSQVCWAALLCNGQTECNQGWSFDQIEYTPYTSGYVHQVDGPISGQ
jgi:hypothetical protein